MEIYSLENKIIFRTFVMKIIYMKEVIVFGGSSSKRSINKKLAILASTKLQNKKITILDLNDFPLPMYSVDTEGENGFPEHAVRFNNFLSSTDGIIISLAEHNGAYTAAFKNLFDWLSRIDKNIWKNKPMLLMSTSPGGRGGASVFSTANNSFPRMGGNIVASFSLNNFETNYSDDKILDLVLYTNFLKEIIKFEETL